ncbi:hypothetical protein OK016_00670 [Vibrio chagasii]|nr:hypothetical protein [Vibrio chagasii]
MESKCSESIPHSRRKAGARSSLCDDSPCEAMEGFGYPRGLTGEELSIPERILAVAE